MSCKTKYTKTVPGDERWAWKVSNCTRWKIMCPMLVCLSLILLKFNTFPFQKYQEQICSWSYCTTTLWTTRSSHVYSEKFPYIIWCRRQHKLWRLCLHPRRWLYKLASTFSFRWQEVLKHDWWGPVEAHFQQSRTWSLYWLFVHSLGSAYIFLIRS